MSKEHFVKYLWALVLGISTFYMLQRLTLAIVSLSISLFTAEYCSKYCNQKDHEVSGTETYHTYSWLVQYVLEESQDEDLKGSLTCYGRISE